MKTEDKMSAIVSLAKRRGFIFPGSEIYGGLQNSWDYGPYGVELKNNIKQEWWQRFVKNREDVIGLDAALIMNPKVWQASGHLETFTDPLVECKKCHTRFRADQIDTSKACIQCGEENSFTEEKSFNLMLKTFLGPSEEAASTVYFRPETAQAIFVNFKNVLDTTRKRLPFGIAQIGKAFRNEITPGNFIFRTREFEQMEIEYFIKPENWEETFTLWENEIKDWLKDIGIAEEKLHFEDIPDGDRAHYSKKTIDIEYDFPFGKKELYGLAYRTDFDLQNHIRESKQDLSYTDPETGEKIVPHVIEPSFGVDRTVLAVLLEAYTEEKLEGDDTRVVLKFPKKLAPVKVAVFPLLKNKPELVAKAREVFETLKKEFVCEFDDNGNVGKRYRRQDEIGTPYCVTIDFESLEDGAVTVRDRDSMEQERVKIEELKSFFYERLTF